MMNEPGFQLRLRTRTMQIITGALLAGAITFALVVLFLVQNNGGEGLNKPPAEIPILSFIAIFMLVSEIGVAFVFPKLIERQALERLLQPQSMPGSSTPAGDPGTITTVLANAYQTSLIVKLALFEGASFFASIAYLVEARPFALAVSAAAIALMVSQWPGETRVTNWMQTKQREVQDRRFDRGLR